jgi:hypothetical protein
MIRFSSERPVPPISSEEAVLAVLAASPGHQVHGKKRFHKITFFCAYCDQAIQARFSIRHFGVFSTEIADALDVLSTFGDLETRDEQVGPNRYFTTVFSLHEKAKHRSTPVISEVAKMLARYTTPSLEVASTVAYFTRRGFSEADAVEETTRIKPAISTPSQFAISKNLLKELADLRASKHGQRSENP